MKDPSPLGQTKVEYVVSDGSPSSADFPLIRRTHSHFRVMSRFDDQTEVSDSFSSRWGEVSDGDGWMKESKKPEPDFFLTSTMSSLDDR